MKILDYFMPKTYPAPPLVEPGRHGNITRFDPTRVAKPIESKKPAIKAISNNPHGRPSKEDMVLEAIRLGLCSFLDIQSEVAISRQCLLRHIQKLEKKGAITVDRSAPRHRFELKEDQQ